MRLVSDAIEVVVLMASLVVAIVGGGLYLTMLGRALPIHPTLLAQAQRTRAHNLFRVATHEVGHLIALWACPFAIDIIEARVDERGDGEVLWTFPSHDTKNLLWSRLVIGLAGIAAELAVYGTFRSGHSKADLSRAREVAETLAMMGSVAPSWMADGPSPELPFEQVFAEPLRFNEIRLLQAAYGKARALILARPEVRDRLALRLAKTRRLSCEDIAAELGPRVTVALALARTHQVPFLA